MTMKCTCFDAESASEIATTTCLFQHVYATRWLDCIRCILSVQEWVGMNLCWWIEITFLLVICQCHSLEAFKMILVRNIFFQSLLPSSALLRENLRHTFYTHAWHNLFLRHTNSWTTSNLISYRLSCTSRIWHYQRVMRIVYCRWLVWQYTYKT